MPDDVTATPGATMVYLIKRRATATREQLVAHWFANHMPKVIANQEASAAKGRSHATRYVATLFDAGRDGGHVWDGMAQLWWDRVLPQPAEPHGTTPTDSFQQHADPYVPWATREHVVIDGADRLPPVRPLTLDPPFPTTRSGFHKVVFLVGAQPGIDHDELFRHWIDVHIPNVRDVMARVGGWRYVVRHSIEPSIAPYAGIAELTFPDVDAFKAFNSTIQPDGMERWTDPSRTDVLRSHTEMIGIP